MYNVIFNCTHTHTCINYILFYINIAKIYINLKNMYINLVKYNNKNIHKLVTFNTYLITDI